MMHFKRINQLGVALLGVISGMACAADITVTSTFVPATMPGCNSVGFARSKIVLPGVGVFYPYCGDEELSWTRASAYCTESLQINLPTPMQYKALYDLYPENQLEDVWQWDTSEKFWSAVKVPNEEKKYYSVALKDGKLEKEDVRKKRYFACIRVY